MLEEAKRLDSEAGVYVAYSVAKPEETGLPDRSFDAVTAGQCWHWFDRPKAVEEVRRVLRPAGGLVIAHFDPIPLPGNVMEVTGKLIGRHNPDSKSVVDQTGFSPSG